MNINLKGFLLVFLGLIILYPPFGNLILEYAWLVIGFYCLFRGICLLVGNSHCNDRSCNRRDNKTNDLGLK